MILDFIKAYWREIIEVVAILISIVICCIKKKPIKIVDSVKAQLIETLPTIINRVENYKDVFEPTRKLSGDEKLRMALNICEAFLVDDLHIPEADLCIYRSWLVQHIEDILSTPQKKGVRHEE